MEFLDSLDLDTIDKKSHRVRSWYLYEQFKSLERSQLDAAQKLKDRSYQERILRQELSERRARRKLYDQFGLCQSDSRLVRDKSASNNRTTVSTSDDDFFESFYLLHEDERVTQITGANEFSEGEGDAFSQDCLSVSQCCIPNYVSVEDRNKDDNGSYGGSVTSVVENLKPSNDEFVPPPNEEFILNSIEDTKMSISEDIKSSIDDDIDIKSSIGEDIKNSLAKYLKNSIAEDLKNSTPEDLKNSTPEDLKNSTPEDLKNSTPEDLKNSIADELNMQFDSVKEDILCLEKIANLEDVDKISEESFNKVVKPEHVEVSKKADQECNVIALWSRLVSFAYQVVQLNHGNCYCDYSSQFLTVVLACDVLRLGVNRMCHILQPYVSPIKFASDELNASEASHTLNVKRKKSVQSRKYRKICEIKPLSRKKAQSLFRTRRSARKSTSSSENCSWQPFYTQSFAKGTEAKARPRGWSEPWRGSTKIYNNREEISSESSLSSAIWSDLLNKKPKVTRRHSYRYHNKALHPMLKIAQCIDSILKDIDDYKHDIM